MRALVREASYLFEMLRRHPSTLLGIILGKALIDCSEVREVLVLGQSKPDLKDQPIDLSVELHSEERHPLSYIIINATSIMSDMSCKRGKMRLKWRSRDSYRREQQSHELREQQELEIQAIFQFDGTSQRHGLILVMPELETKEIHLNLEQLIRQEQYNDPWQFLLYPFFESIVPSVPQLLNSLFRTPSSQ